MYNMYVCSSASNNTASYCEFTYKLNVFIHTYACINMYVCTSRLVNTKVDEKYII